MALFLVTSDRCTHGARGETVDLDETDLGVRALVDSRHLRPAPKPVKPVSKRKGD